MVRFLPLDLDLDPRINLPFISNNNIKSVLFWDACYGC